MELNDKQLAILLVAENLFAEKGFKSTSVRKIAKEANINIAMISYYFGSKEKMLDALLLHRLSGYKLQLESVISSDKDYLQKIDEIILLTIQRVHKNRQTHKIVNVEFSKGNLQTNFDNYLKLKKENYQVVEDFVIRGQEAGVFKKNINTKLIAPTILGTYFHFYYNKRFFQELLTLEGAADINAYVANTLTPHIQKTIKALLTHED